MKRRIFLTGATALTAATMSWRAAAQAPAMLRVGSASARHPARGFLAAFGSRMREHGYIEGQNLILDYIDLQGRTDRYMEATQELVERKADIIIAFGPEDTLKAAMAATKSIPIVMVAIDYDPFALGYVTSLARPVGNVTGMVLEQIELAAKRLQLVKDAFPAVSKAVVFWDRLSADQWRATRDNAAKFGLDLVDVELRD